MIVNPAPILLYPWLLRYSKIGRNIVRIYSPPTISTGICWSDSGSRLPEATLLNFFLFIFTLICVVIPLSSAIQTTIDFYKSFDMKKSKDKDNYQNDDTANNDWFLHIIFRFNAYDHLLFFAKRKIVKCINLICA